MVTHKLMIKIHNITGLRYLCQTKKKNPHKYLGSGKEWIAHLSKFGANITTTVIAESQDKQLINDLGRYYSKKWNIVNGQDDFGNKIWANMIPETGGGGGNAFISPEAIKKRAATQTGTKKPLSHKLKCSSRMLREHADPTSVYNSAAIKLKKSISMKKHRQDKTSDSKFNTPEYHQKIKESCKKGAAHRKQHYLITSPEGITYKIVGICDFCKDHNLNKGAMCAVTRGEIPHYKGWTGTKLSQ